jgi:hypothetical protein
MSNGAETELALAETLRGTFDASGIAVGSIQVGPNQRWKVTLMNTSTTSTSQTRCTVYRGLLNGQQLDFSRTGNADTSNTDIELQQGEKLVVEWTGGTVGTTAALDIEGKKYLKGRRGY